MKGERTCGWCGDYESQHDERGCKICRGMSSPWDRGKYRCDRFYATREEASLAKGSLGSARRARRDDDGTGTNMAQE